MSRGSCLFNAIGNPDLRQSADPAGRRGGRPFGSNAGSISARKRIRSIAVYRPRTSTSRRDERSKGTTTNNGNDNDDRICESVERLAFPESAAGVLDREGEGGREREREREKRGRD